MDFNYQRPVKGENGYGFPDVLNPNPTPRNPREVVKFSSLDEMVCMQEAVLDSACIAAEIAKGFSAPMIEVQSLGFRKSISFLIKYAIVNGEVVGQIGFPHFYAFWDGISLGYSAMSFSVADGKPILYLSGIFSGMASELSSYGLNVEVARPA